MDVMDVTNVTDERDVVLSYSLIVTSLPALRDERDVVLSYSLIVTSSRRHFVTSSRRPPIPP